MASMTHIPQISPSARRSVSPHRSSTTYAVTQSEGCGRIGPHLGTVSLVDVRIGVTQAPRELNVEVPDDECDDAEKQIEAALGGAVEVLWLTDKRGRRIGVPAAKIAYIEVGTNDGDRRIGFGG